MSNAGDNMQSVSRSLTHTMESRSSTLSLVKNEEPSHWESLAPSNGIGLYPDSSRSTLGVRMREKEAEEEYDLSSNRKMRTHTSEGNQSK